MLTIINKIPAALLYGINFITAKLSLPFDRWMRLTSDPTRLDKKRLLLWVAVNIFLLFAYVVLPDLWCFPHLSLSLVVVHFLLMLGALLVFYEEDSIWTGLVAKSDALFPENSTLKRFSVLAVSTVMFVLFLSAALLAVQREGWTLVLKLSSECNTKLCQFPKFVGTVFGDLAFIGPAARRRGWIPPEAWSQPIGWYVVQLIYYGSHFWLFTFLLRIILHYRSMHSLVNAIVEAKDDRVVRFLQMRAAFAPPYIKRLIIDLALRGPSDIARRRAIAIVPHARIFSFPQTFAYHLPLFSEELQIWGLSRNLKFLVAEQENFAPERLTDLIRNLSKHLYRAGRLEAGVERRASELLWEAIGILKSRNELKTQWPRLPKQFFVQASITGPEELRSGYVGMVTVLDAPFYCKHVIFSLDQLGDESDVLGALRSCQAIGRTTGSSWNEADVRRLHSLITVKRSQASDNVKRELTALRKVMSEVRPIAKTK